MANAETLTSHITPMMTLSAEEVEGVGWSSCWGSIMARPCDVVCEA